MSETAKEVNNWVDAMIERESIPKAARRETVAEFCSKWEISEATYYNHSSKEENQKKIVKLSLMLVKKSLPEVLEKLRDKAEEGDMKAVDMFLNYVAELSKNIDVKSGGEKLPQPILTHALPSNNSNTEDIIAQAEN